MPLMNDAPDTQTARWSIGRLLAWTTDYLAERHVDDARLATEVLLAHAAGLRRIDLYARPEQELDEASLVRFREWVRRAALHEPIAYLVEQKEFFSLTFHVTRDVLIPRPETELLVECIVDHCGNAKLSEPHMLDLGTGSGCVAVTLLAQIAGAEIVASDVSPAALAVAKANAERHGVADRLQAIEADRLALPADALPAAGFDILVSNPPYVAAEAVEALVATVRDHEPSIALTDGGDGLSFYRSIAADGPALLSTAGVVFVEVGDGQASAVMEIMQSRGGFSHEKTWKDRVVGHERVLMFSRSPKH